MPRLPRSTPLLLLLIALAFPLAAQAQNDLAETEKRPDPIELTIDFASIQQATELEVAGDVDGALAALVAASAEHPEDATLVAAHGVVLLRRGDVDGARTDFQRAVEVNADDPSGYAGLCYLAVLDGKEGTAHTTCTTARNRNLVDPAYVQVSVTFGMLEEGAVAAAAEALQPLVAANPYVPALRLVSLEVNLRMKRFGEARVDLEMLQQMYRPASGVPRIIDRLAAFRMADLYGTDLDCYLSSATLQIAEGEGQPPSVADLERVAACRPDDGAVTEQLVQQHNADGMAARAAGDSATAVEHFKAALALKERDPVLLTNLSYAAFEGQDLATAEEALRTLLEVTPDDAEARRNYGIVLMALGREAEARPYLEEAQP